jgi:mono/diheme cytochrome c family protein
MRRWLEHPFWQAILILVVAYVLVVYGIAYVPPLLGIGSAPVPGSVVLQFMLTVLAGILIYVSDSEEKWRRFQEPIRATMVDPGKRYLRLGLLIAIPLLVGWLAFQQVRETVAAPPSLRSIHPAPPSAITFRGGSMTLAGIDNPLRGDGSITEDYERGKEVYYRNCVACHGDALDGQGHYAHGFAPTPLPFTGTGTIAQLTESFVFWRIAKGGPGLPKEGAPWNSAMPAWEEFLSEEEIWAVIIFLYEQTGNRPRTWAEAGEPEAEP